MGTFFVQFWEACLQLNCEFNLRWEAGCQIDMFVFGKIDVL